MDLQEKLIELSEYNVSFNVANGNFVIRIKYDENWTIIQPDGEDISFFRDDKDDTVYYYVASITVGIDRLFYAIDETIDYNHELEEKIVLFKEKMNELQELFTSEPIDVLSTLEFKVKKRKDKQKKEKTVQEEKANVEEKITSANKKNEKKKKDEHQIEPEKENKTSEIDDKISELLNNNNKKG